MNLNRMAVLECPEYDIPWFHEEYCKSLERGGLRIQFSVSLQEEELNDLRFIDIL